MVTIRLPAWRSRAGACFRVPASERLAGRTTHGPPTVLTPADVGADTRSPQGRRIMTPSDHPPTSPDNTTPPETQPTAEPQPELASRLSEDASALSDVPPPLPPEALTPAKSEPAENGRG